jgi:hypothetical protein
MSLGRHVTLLVGWKVRPTAVDESSRETDTLRSGDVSAGLLVAAERGHRPAGGRR